MITAFGGGLALAGCASLVNPSASDVQIVAHPVPAHCEVTGHDGFAASLDTPATVSVPHAAAPVTVSCTAPGYKRTVNSLQATPSGWIWGNTALIPMTGGVVALALVVDQTLGSDWTYRPDHSVDMEAERERAVTIRSRDGTQQLDLKAR